MKYLLNYQDVEFTSLIFLWIGLGLATLTIIFRVFAQKIHNKNKGEVSFAEVRETFSSGLEYAKLSNFVKTITLGILFVLLGVMFANPFTQKFEGSVTVEKIEHARTVIAVIDVSGSMASSELSDEDSNFNIVRDAFIVFLEEAENMRVGVVFFSAEAIPFRRPTQNLNYLISDMESLDLSHKSKNSEEQYQGLGLNQLKHISFSTNTPNGLKKAGEILISLNMSEKELRNSTSIILFSDLIDSMKDVAEVITQFTSVGVRVHVIATAKQHTINKFSREILGNDLVKVYNVKSSNDVRSAFEAINKLESISFTTQEIAVHRKDLKTEVAIVFIYVYMVLIFMAEVVFHRLRGGSR